jgi:hypothetical protein
MFGTSLRILYAPGTTPDVKARTRLLGGRIASVLLPPLGFLVVYCGPPVPPTIGVVSTQHADGEVPLQGAELLPDVGLPPDEVPQAVLLRLVLPLQLGKQLLRLVEIDGDTDLLLGKSELFDPRPQLVTIYFCQEPILDPD